jgi:cell division protein FtsA
MTGGAMLLPGAVDMAQIVIGMPVRMGVPDDVAGLTDVVSSPAYAGAVGLVLYGVKQQERNFFRVRDDATILTKVKHRMSDWLSEFF